MVLSGTQFVPHPGKNEANQFFVPEGRYFLSHSVGCLPKDARTNLEKTFLKTWAEKGGDAWPQWLETIEGFCAELATLFALRAADICPQPSVSAGFSNYLVSLPGNGRRKVVMHADAFPTMGFAARALENAGLELALIDNAEAADDVGVWQQHLGPDVLAALITHVHSNTGVISPVAEIAELCSAQGIYSIVDVAQSAGIVDVKPLEWGVNALVGSCVKWLCGGPGAGYLWIEPDHAQALSPEHVGWFSHQDPFEFDIHSFRLKNTARKFWGGTPSVAPYATATGSLRALQAIGFATIRAHNLALKQAALEGLDAETLMANLPRNCGGTLCLHLSSDQSTAFELALNRENCKFDRRGDTFRLSFHIYTPEEDAAAINTMLKSIL